MSSKPPARLRDGRALTRLGLAAGLVVPVSLLGVPAAVAIPVTVPAATGAVADAVADAVTVAAPESPACGDPDGEDFPIETRIHGGPDTYASGGGYGTWFLDLTNTTSESCHSIHPVLVLTDEDRTLTAEQIQLQFTERAHPDEEHRVSWESTDRDEQIGVFGGGEQDDDFPGFTVPARKTVTVEVRMAFTSDTRPGKVTAHAAIVQRRAAGDEAEQAGSDGDWVGESAAYSFAVVDGGVEAPGDDGATTDAEGDAVPELARTGQARALRAGLAAVTLVLAGAAALLWSRRLRGGRR
ncbi:hypothetical protein OG265_13320 [Streptomyces sp. NBC_01208]|uniref:hypothetical protein n=1 Tax=unclassified Streptomyces TaxID=2593676 RepID=UPI002E1314F1|nr:hypothetical protein OG725_22420 [Streptomyces sp. NBC_01213]WSR06921.1 hypothetical protein OG265_13320 [Streptomyces sp. NBC_01208]